jgi:hypothetical protein
MRPLIGSDWKRTHGRSNQNSSVPGAKRLNDLTRKPCPACCARWKTQGHKAGWCKEHAKLRWPERYIDPLPGDKELAYIFMCGVLVVNGSTCLDVGQVPPNLYGPRRVRSPRSVTRYVQTARIHHHDVRKPRLVVDYESAAQHGMIRERT